VSAMLKGKTIILGVTGGIAAYKAVDLASQLTKAGAKVEVIMTDAAMEFIPPLTFRTVTGRPVVTNMFDLTSEYSVEHVALAESADIVVIAPATANTIAKLACGITDNMLTTTVLATRAPVIVSPAMNVDMWENSITQENISKLRNRGFIMVGPDYGRLASGRIGMGRFVDISKIFGTVCQVLGKDGDLAGKHIVVTAGGTQEPIDPVRCVTNHSSGKMGYALAEASRDRGARVTLITAPSALPRPVGIDTVNIHTAQEMYQAVETAVIDADALIMAAAVADYRPVNIADNKIKRQASSSLTIEFERTSDILGEIKGQFIRIGFAAESENIIANAMNKIEKKQLDLIIANDITDPLSTFGSDTNQVALISPGGKVEHFPPLLKREVADIILDRMVNLVGKPAASEPGNEACLPADSKMISPALEIEPLVMVSAPEKLKVGQQLDHQVTHSEQRYKLIQLDAAERSFFPRTDEKFDVHINFDVYHASISDKNHIKGIKEAFKAHPIKKGERLVFTVIEPNKYRLFRNA
jgi:phosphopantothenoylcysteine decarboxylase/phosphopantothenate--cysteine ligase